MLLVNLRDLVSRESLRKERKFLKLRVPCGLMASWARHVLGLRRCKFSGGLRPRNARRAPFRDQPCPPPPGAPAPGISPPRSSWGKGSGHSAHRSGGAPPGHIGACVHPDAREKGLESWGRPSPRPGPDPRADPRPRSLTPSLIPDPWPHPRPRSPTPIPDPNPWPRPPAPTPGPPKPVAGAAHLVGPGAGEAAESLRAAHGGLQPAALGCGAGVHPHRAVADREAGLAGRTEAGLDRRPPTLAATRVMAAGGHLLPARGREDRRQGLPARTLARLSAVSPGKAQG